MMAQMWSGVRRAAWAWLRRVTAPGILVAMTIGAGVAAQESLAVSVSGRVVAGPERTPVPAAVVVGGDTRTVTDATGTFVLPLMPGLRRLTVSVSNLDVEVQQVDVQVAPGMAPIEITLVARPPVRESVTVSAEGGAALAAPATVSIAPAAVLRVAGAGDNIFKALQTLPSVTATDDFSSRLSVRGGGPDQNLTVMDGVEIHNPYRLFGLTSAFNPETIERFELTAGGFGVDYGDRLSSILVVENRVGSGTARLTGSAALSFTDTNLVLEGKLPGRAVGSWLVTGRRTYYDLIADRLTGNDLPSFGDVQAKTDWQLRPGHSLRLFGIRSREKTDAEFTDSGDRIFLGDLSANDLVSASYRGLFGPKVLVRTTAAWYDYGDDLAVDGSLRDGARRANVPGDEGVTRALIVFTRRLGVRDLSLRQQVDVQASGRHSLGVGADVHALRTTWGWTITGDRNTSVANGSSVQGGAGLPSLLESTRASARGALWVLDRVSWGSRVRLEPGIRVDWNSLNAEVIASPRVSAVVDLAAGTRLRTAVGRFTQSPGYEKLLQSDYFVDLTERTAQSLSSERAVHAIVGLEREVSPSMTIRVEAYAKRFRQMILGRLETPDETAARVARYEFPAAWQSSVPTAPIITSAPENGGSGRAYGFDLYAERRQRRAHERLSGWVSYTWGRATMHAYGVTKPLDYDRRHAVSLVSTYGLSRRIDLGTTLRVASGFPATLPVGLRVTAADAADGSGRLVPALDDRGRPVWGVDFGDASNLSRGRLPVYARLDLRVTFKPRSPAGRWQVYLDVLNALDRANVSQLQPDLEYDPTSDRPRITYSSDSGLPRLPSVGFRYRF